MEPGVRKILPRVQQSGAEPVSDAAVEALKNGNGVVEAIGPATAALWRASMGEEEHPPKRKRHQVDEDSSASRSQTLPSLRQLALTVPQPSTSDVEKAGPIRLVRTNNGAYAQQGAYRFLAPRPPREFPLSVSADPRELSFAAVDPDLMDVFKHAWYLRHHIRQKRMQRDVGFDHFFFNDAYGIDNVLNTWTSPYDPGTLQYPASILYKQCLWIFFTRSTQASLPTAASAQVVNDGLHYLRQFEAALGPTGDRSVLLIPTFLLGTTCFYTDQRREICAALDRLDPNYNNEPVTHAARSLERLWELIDDGGMHLSWDWEKYQAHDSTMANGDRSLIDLLWDPLAPAPAPVPPPAATPAPQVARVRSPETFEFDAGRFRAAQQPPVPPPPVAEYPRGQREETDVFSPPQQRSPPRQSTTSGDSEPMRVDGNQEASPAQIEVQPGPRPFLAPPPPSSSVGSNSELMQVLQRKSTKSKSLVPPCPTCGKELKNPSDAQSVPTTAISWTERAKYCRKHQLQHSKPFRCREPGCTRTQGFATENDLQRHRKSVHGASPRIGNKIGYVCAACPDPSDGTSRKWWPRLDNFKAHIRRKHHDADEESLIQACVFCLLYCSRLY